MIEPRSPRRTGRRAVALVLALLASFLATESVSAQGFGVYENGACAQGRAGAAVAQPCDDGSGVFFSPAGVETEPGELVVSAGFTGIFATGAFEPDGTEEGADLDNRQPVPLGHAFAAWSPSSRLTLAVGAFTPYGLETAWPLSFEGRFVGYDNALQTVYVQPTVAYRVLPWLRVGGGLDVVFSSVQLRRRLDLAEQPLPPPAPAGTTFGDVGIPEGTDFADARLESDWAAEYTGHVGLLLEPAQAVRLGLRYLAEAEVSYEGTAEFRQVPTGIELDEDNPFGVPAGTSLDDLLEGAGLFGPGGPLADGGLRTGITMPDQLVAGIALRAGDRLLLEADYQHTDWSDFDRVHLDFVNEETPDEEIVLEYRDTHGVRVGADYAATPRLNLRAGWIRNEAAAPDAGVTPLLPEASRQHLTVGVGWKTRPGWTLEAAYQLLLQDDRRGRVRSPAEGEEPTTDLDAGRYEFTGHLAALTVRVAF